jgi:hypothetical protein
MLDGAMAFATFFCKRVGCASKHCGDVVVSTCGVFVRARARAWVGGWVVVVVVHADINGSMAERAMHFLRPGD